jgi:hypothetical protein
MNQVTYANADAVKWTLKTHTAHVQAQFRPRLRTYVLEVDQDRRLATETSTAGGPKGDERYSLGLEKKIEKALKPKKTGLHLTEHEELMQLNHPHENQPSAHHDDEQHLENVATHVAHPRDAPKLHQNLQRPLTANQCRVSETI